MKLSPGVTAREAACPDCGHAHRLHHEIKVADGQLVAVEKGWKCDCCRNWKQRNVTFDKVSWKIIDSPLRADIERAIIPVDIKVVR